MELSQRAPSIFVLAAITLGIGPHSSSYLSISEINHTGTESLRRYKSIQKTDGQLAH